MGTTLTAWAAIRQRHASEPLTPDEVVSQRAALVAALNEARASGSQSAYDKADAALQRFSHLHPVPSDQSAAIQLPPSRHTVVELPPEAEANTARHNAIRHGRLDP